MSQFGASAAAVLSGSVSLAVTPHAALLPSPEEMARLDTAAISDMQGVAHADLVLMERAGRAVAKHLRRNYRRQLQASGALILCGPGNNGGDGLVVARLLHAAGIRVQIVLCAADRYSSGCSEQRARVAVCKIPIRIFPQVTGASQALGKLEGPCSPRPCSAADLERLLSRTQLVVDALLGTGQQSAPRGHVGAAIEILHQALSRRAGPVFQPTIKMPGIHGNSLIEGGACCSRNEVSPQCRLFGGERGTVSMSSLSCVAIDIPSGMNAATGEVYVPHVVARETVAMELVKRGMLQYPGRSLCGAISAIDIGISASPQVPVQWKLLTPPDVWVPFRPLPPDAGAASHKGTYGHVYVVAGCADMPGAALLASRAAARSGAGLVTMVRFKDQAAVTAVPEVLHHSLPEASLLKCQDDVLGRMRAASCTIIGPGLGLSSEVSTLVEKLVAVAAQEKLPVVLDADALTILAGALSKKPLDLSSAIVTPHPGEMSRLLGVSTEEIQRDRYGAAEKLHRITGAVVVLKGAGTVIYSGAGGFVCPTGNAGMASGGSGDVLSGIIAALAAQLRLHGNGFLDLAARSGVYLHGVAGDFAQGGRGVPLLAGDIIDNISQAIWMMR